MSEKENTRLQNWTQMMFSEIRRPWQISMGAHFDIIVTYYFCLTILMLQFSLQFHDSGPLQGDQLVSVQFQLITKTYSEAPNK